MPLKLFLSYKRPKICKKLVYKRVWEQKYKPKHRIAHFRKIQKPRFAILWPFLGG